MVTLSALARVLLASASLAVAQPIPGDVSPSAHTGNPTLLKARAASPAAASPTAATKDLPLLPAAPPPPPLTKAVPWEYFTVVTLLSAPFTALWCGLAVGIAASIEQRRLPPQIGPSLYASVGAAAGAASVAIGLFSLSWGGAPPTPVAASPARSPVPAPRETPKPASGGDPA